MNSFQELLPYYPKNDSLFKIFLKYYPDSEFDESLLNDSLNKHIDFITHRIWAMLYQLGLRIDLNYYLKGLSENMFKSIYESEFRQYAIPNFDYLSKSNDIFTKDLVIHCLLYGILRIVSIEYLHHINNLKHRIKPKTLISKINRDIPYKLASFVFNYRSQHPKYQF